MRRLLVILALLSASTLCLAAPTVSTPIKSVFIWPGVHRCMDNGLHGDVYVIDAADRQVRLTRDGMCARPKLSPDGNTVGWVHGRHKDLWGDEDRWFLPNELVLWRDGKQLQRIKAEGGDYTGWDFAGNGTQVAVAVGSRQTHANAYFLYDIATLRKVDACTFWHPSVTGAMSPPDWAKPIWLQMPAALAAP